VAAAAAFGGTQVAMIAVAVAALALLRASGADALTGSAAGLPPAASRPIFNITASSLYDAGRQHGQHAASRIRDWLQSEELVDLVAYAQGRGQGAFEELKRTNAALYPQYVDELRGIAAGSGVDLDRVWVLNLITELEALGRTSRSGHCSDIFAVSSGNFAHGHNEDWPGPVMSLAYFVKYTAAAGAGFNSCAGFVYPGTMLGWGPTWNSHGVYVTENSLFPVRSRAGGAAWAFAQREAICGSAGGLGHEGVSEEITRHTWSSGASVNIVDIRRRRLVNIEVNEDRSSVHVISDGAAGAANYSHFNMYKHLDGADTPQASSIDRQARVDALPAVRSYQDVLERLSDHENPEHPIFRNDTLMTTAFDSASGRMSVWCCGRSAATHPPSHTWDMLHFFDPVAAHAEILI